MSGAGVNPDDQDEGQDDGVQQRVVPASDAVGINTAAPNSVFNLHGFGLSTSQGSTTPADTSSTDAGTTTSNQHEEETMATATTKRKGAARARKSSNGSPQHAMCTALADGDLGRDALQEALPDFTAPQLASALNNAKSKGRIVWIEKGQAFHLTKEGKAWLASTSEAPPAGEDPATQEGQRAGKSGAHRRKATRRRDVEVDTSPPSDDDETTFRCAVMSDGAFFLSKGDAVIELEPDEHRQMLAYLERMAEAA